MIVWCCCRALWVIVDRGCDVCPESLGWVPVPLPGCVLVETVGVVFIPVRASLAVW